MKKFFKNLWERWKIIAKAIGRFNALVILTLFYFVILSPLGALFRLFGWNPLKSGQKEHQKDTNWQPVENSQPDTEALKRQS